VEPKLYTFICKGTAEEKRSFDAIVGFLPESELKSQLLRIQGRLLIVAELDEEAAAAQRKQ
jgi:hypothetical protein